MTTSEVKKAAKESILGGSTKQETFEKLKDASTLPVKTLATIIRGIPSVQAKQKYKVLNMALIALLVVLTVFKIIAAVQLGGIDFLLIFSVAVSILFIWGIATYTPGVHLLTAVISVWGLIQMAKSIIGQPFDPLMAMIFSATLLIIIALSFYLYTKLYPPFKITKEAYTNSQENNKQKGLILFNDEAV